MKYFRYNFFSSKHQHTYYKSNEYSPVFFLLYASESLENEFVVFLQLVVLVGQLLYSGLFGGEVLHGGRILFLRQGLLDLGQLLLLLDVRLAQSRLHVHPVGFVLVDVRLVGRLQSEDLVDFAGLKTLRNTIL